MWLFKIGTEAESSILQCYSHFRIHDKGFFPWTDKKRVKRMHLRTPTDQNPNIAIEQSSARANHGIIFR